MVINNPVITGSFTVNGVNVAGITGSSNVSSSFLVVSQSYAATSASYAQTSGSLSIRTSNLEATASTLVSASSSFAAQSASLSTRLTTDESNYTSLSSSFTTTSGSAAGRLTTIETTYATTGSNTFTGLQYINSTVNAAGFTTTASLYTCGGARIAKDLYVSGTSYFTNVVVYGTSSIQYLTSSQINVGANIINLNTQTPAVRFGGMAVADSGSNAGVTGSFLWDSVNNNWIYTRESGSTYSGGAMISGPKNLGAIGSEQTTTACYLMAGQGGDHITSSMIYTDSTVTCIPTPIVGGSTACFSGALTLGATNFLSTTNQSTNAVYMSIQNSGGITYFGRENSAGTNYSATAYSTILYSGGPYPIEFFTNGTKQLAIASTGAACFASCITAGGKITINKDLEALTVNGGTSTNAAYMSFQANTQAGWLIVGSQGSTANYIQTGTGANESAITTVGAYALTFGTNQTERMRITSGGCVGIGTTSPINKLSVNISDSTTYSSTSTGNVLTLYNTSTTTNGYAGIDFISEPASGNAGRAAINTIVTGNGTADLAFSTRSSTMGERMRITSGGNVGIGATSPLGRLEVADYTTGVTAGDFIVNTSTKYVYVGRQSSTSGDNTTFVVRDRVGTSRATIPGGGSIDTTFSTNSSNFIVTNYSGTSLMTIANSGATTFSGAVTANQFVIPASSTYRLNTNTDGLLGYMLRSGTWKGTSENHLSLATDSANGIAFYTNGSGTERMLVTSSGSVLVGTTTENTTVSRLQVKADSGAQAISVIGRTSDGISQYMFMNAANSGIYGFMQGSSDGGGRITMVANSAGGVYLASGATSWTAVSSDTRKKKNFETTQGLNEILQIEPIKYHFNWEEDTKPKRLGFKAQNILPLIPEMVSATGEIAEDGSDYLTVTPDYILPVLVKAIQEQQCTINTLKTCLGII